MKTKISKLFATKDKAGKLILMLMLLMAVNLIIMASLLCYSNRQDKLLVGSDKSSRAKAVILADIEESMKLQGLWFIKNQTDLGDFVYETDVNSGESLGGNNEVRQAGSLYSLAQLYKYSKDETVEKTLQKGLIFFREYLQSQNNDGISIAITYNGTTKSNTTALYLLSLIEYMEASDKAKQKYSQIAEQLGNYLVSTQLDSGGFVYYYDNYKGENISYSESDYNNGETFYALVRLYKFSKNQKIIGSVNKAADYLIQKYSSNPINLSFYAWGMEGFAHLYDINPKEEYWDFMKAYTDKYFIIQGNDVAKYFMDKNDATPPKGSLGVYVEGLTHVAWIAKRKNSEYSEQVKTFIQYSINYLMSLQIDGPQAERFSSIESVKGGTCFDFTCKTIRIDIVHHVLSANYLYLTLVK